MQVKMKLRCFRTYTTGLLNMLLVVSALSGCATTGGSPDDPLEPMNRQFFQFNTDVDEGILQPMAKAYRHVMPDLARKGINNFSGNLSDAYSFANNVLQLKPTNAGQDLVRVAFNTAFGLGGLIDIAGSVGIEKQNQDFGLTLARWGVGTGPYLVLPLLGPSTLRDSMDDVVLLYHAPSRYLFRDWRARTAYQYLSLLEFRVQLMDAEAVLDSSIIDRYQQVRDMYLQRRAYLVSGGEVDYDLDDLDDEDFDSPSTGSDTVSPQATQPAASGVPQEVKVSKEPTMRIESKEHGQPAADRTVEEDKKVSRHPSRQERSTRTRKDPSRKENVLSVPSEVFSISR